MQRSIFSFKGFTRSINHNGENVDISHAKPGVKRKKLFCEYCNEEFANQQGLSIHIKCKHSTPAKKPKKNPFSEKQTKEQEVVKDILYGVINKVVKLEQGKSVNSAEVIVIDDENIKPKSNRKG